MSGPGAATGVGMMTAAIGDLASHAGGDDRLEPVKPSDKSSTDIADESAPASEAEAKPLQTDRKQLEAKFKHAEQFGVQTPRGQQGFSDFDKALKDFVNDPQRPRHESHRRDIPG
jgi:pyocin large subunit-like protein